MLYRVSKSALFLAALFFCVHTTAHALTFAQLMSTITGTINALTSVLLAAAFVGFLWTGVQYMQSASGEKRKEHINRLVFGVVALFAIFSVWGIVAFLSGLILLP
jgi:hypothetical protein